jgi:pimeloyl-ACP methyl ester carboxylesterase
VPPRQRKQVLPLVTGPRPLNHRVLPYCAALLGRPGLPAWTGDADGQVLPHASGRVAYSTVGAGPPLLCDSGWVTHLAAQLELFCFGSFVEGLAERYTVIRYDKPGCGLSDRDGADLSFDRQVAVALAVADAVGADRFSLFGASQGGQLASPAVSWRWPGSSPKG